MINKRTAFHLLPMRLMNAAVVPKVNVAIQHDLQIIQCNDGRYVLIEFKNDEISIYYSLPDEHTELDFEKTKFIEAILVARYGDQRYIHYIQLANKIPSKFSGIYSYFLLEKVCLYKSLSFKITIQFVIMMILNIGAHLKK